MPEHPLGVRRSGTNAEIKGRGAGVPQPFLFAVDRKREREVGLIKTNYKNNDA